ncbi:R2-like ligand-binding oxidase [Effusibacillus pohliae]|uniref:R2-like ligand-binding oxidase n=1 Tax=Effusibacillus pohliae TaxID=232270 RepID=UPI0003612484|nr:R2-like ligand-binding oxidase [Effusibacillus pohliae]
MAGKLATVLDVTETKPFDLYQKAKQFGKWDPQKIDFSKDAQDWKRLDADEKEQIRKICSLFYHGELSVHENLAMYFIAMPRFDQKAFLTTQMHEEAKHAELFAYFFQSIGEQFDTSTYMIPEFVSVLEADLDRRSRALLDAINGPDEEREAALVDAVTHYMGVVEGLLAESGYYALEEMAKRRGILPGLMEGIKQLRIDEGRHITFGMDFLKEAIERNPACVERINAVFDQYLANIHITISYVLDPNPVGIDSDKFLEYSLQQYRNRLEAIGIAEPAAN